MRNWEKYIFPECGMYYQYLIDESGNHVRFCLCACTAVLCTDHLIKKTV